MSTLGKGLGSLIPNKKNLNNLKINIDNNLDKNNQIIYVSINKINSNPYQPRSIFDKDKLDELADSIKKHGILQPIVVSKNKDLYELIAGERRLKAVKLLNFKEIPVIIREVSDRDKLELSIIENIQRQNLNPVEEGKSYQRLIEEFGLTQEEIAQQVGRGISLISSSIRILKLPIVIQEALVARQLTLSHAKIILSYPTKLEQIKIFKKILKNDLSIRQLKNISGQEIEKINERKVKDPIITSWEDKLTKALGAKVKINKKRERGDIKISFFSNEELKNILDKLQ